MNQDCLFCKISAGTIPAKVIAQTDEWIAFHDIRPAAPIHFLIVPKLHIASLAECESQHHALLGRLFGLAPKLARELGCGYDGQHGGFKTVVHTGPAGGQEIYHLHIHVMGSVTGN